MRDKSFLKWSGGKSRLLHKLKRHLPKAKRLIEPFVGSAAVFMSAADGYGSYELADANGDLISLYRHLAADPDDFIAACAVLFLLSNNTADRYRALRAEFNRLPMGSARRAALFVYLNRHGFNGLCRYNADGGFNVSFGRYKQPALPEAAMRAFAARVARGGVQFTHADFRETMALSGPGDVVYCDSPYLSEKTASFNGYTPNGFSSVDHHDLAAACWAAAERGAYVVASNANVPLARDELYAGALIHDVTVTRSISCKSSTRGKAAELIIVIEPRQLALAA